MARASINPPTSDFDVDKAVAMLRHAIATRGGGKVMLRADQAAAVIAVLEGRRPPSCALQEDGWPCQCGLLDPRCEHLIPPRAGLGGHGGDQPRIPTI